MKAIRFFVVGLVVTTIFAGAALAQTTQNPKIGVIDPRFFQQETGGIAKYITALKSLDNEFKPVDQKLQTLANKMNALKTEINTLQKQNGTVPVKQEDVNKKIEEYNSLAREMKYQQEEAKASFESRQQVIMGPIMQDIGNAMEEYRNKNGYSIILDATKLENAGLVLAFDRALDVTQDFIKFYNSRPAGTASTTGAKQ